MKRTLVLLISMLVAGPAVAKTIDWHGTLSISLGFLEPAVVQGSGVAIVNSGSNHLDTLRIAGGITGSDVIPVTDPNTTPTVKSIIITATIGTGTLTGISGAPPLGQNTLPIGGYTRVCVFLSPGCPSFLPLQNTKNSGATGGGVGGLLTIGGNGSIRISLENAPWTLGTITGVNQTVKGAWITLSAQGFVHGPASATNSTTLANSGVVQLVTPQQVRTLGIAGNSADIALFHRLTLHFIPEPGLLLLLGAGIAGLGLLGHSRVRKK